MENLYLKHGLVSRTYSKKSIIMASIIGFKSKFSMIMSPFILSARLTTPLAANSAIRMLTNLRKLMRNSPSTTMKVGMKQKNSSDCPQPQALDTTFEARVRDYMATHTERMDRFKNIIFKQREEINGEEGGSDMTKVTPDNAEKPTETEMETPVMEVKKINKVENGAETKSIKTSKSEEAVGAPGIADDVLVEIAEHVYPIDFVILDIMENKNSPFILGTPFLTTAKALIKFDTSTITLRSGKHKEEKIRLYMEREMQFNQWRGKNFKDMHPTLIAIKEGMDDEGEVT
ncbi:retrovirus-related pol polyprotein from transposon TNT 1-94 [Tanacetum coccineum]